MRLQASLLLGVIGIVAVLVGGCDEKGAEEVVPRPAPAENTADPAPADARLAFAVTDDGDFTKLGKPKPGEWLDQHRERGQTFRAYKFRGPVRATPERRVLAFLPVGEFDEEQRAVARAAVDFAGLWFDLEIRMLTPVDLPAEGFQRRRRFAWNERPVTQYHTSYFLDRLLPRRLPDDAVSLIGVTMGDLYPEDGWNYVFGQADLRNRVGVYSLARYFAEFWGEKDTPAARLEALRRSLKLVTHEIGHTFGIEHCVYYECNMNGSNSLAESDGRPLRLCPVCLRKLQWNREFDVVARYRRLLAFYRERGLTPEAEWTEKRLARILNH